MAAPSQHFLDTHPRYAEVYASGNQHLIQSFFGAHPTVYAEYQRDQSRTNAPPPGSTPTTTTSSGGTTTTTTPSGPAPLAPADQQLVDLFNQSGLGTLATAVVTLVQQGYSGAGLTLQLAQTPEYQQRFAGNQARGKAGLPVLSPAEYLATESSYRDIMKQAGLPAGFYDDPTDFATFIGNGTSPAELQGRVGDAVQLAKNTDPAYRKMLQDTFGIGLTDGDIASYLLDSSRALPILDTMTQAAGIADAARRQGLSYSEQRATQLAQLGITAGQADQQYGQIADATAAYGKAAAATGLQYDQTTAEDELLLNGAGAKQKRQGIETAFSAENPSGASSSAKGANSKDSSGSY